MQLDGTDADRSASKMLKNAVGSSPEEVIRNIKNRAAARQSGRSFEDDRKIALVIEGGGMRGGVFRCGRDRPCPTRILGTVRRSLRDISRCDERELLYRQPSIARDVSLL